MSKASVHDTHYLNDVKNRFEDITILGDKGYLSQLIQMDLFNYQNIRQEVPLGKNQIEDQPQAYILRKKQKENRNLTFTTLRPTQD